VRRGRSRSASSNLAAEWGVAYFADHAQMLEQTKPDAVIVANPNNLHVSTALDCLAVGVAVLLEKPVGVHLDEVRLLVEAEGYVEYRCWPSIGGTTR
jgi:predicted dehydrogenase